MEDKGLRQKVDFQNASFDKKGISKLFALVFQNYSTAKSTLVVDKVKNLLFRHATISSFSFNLEDLVLVSNYGKRRSRMTLQVYLANQNYKDGSFTFIERFYSIKNVWNRLENYPRSDLCFIFA